MEVSLEGGGVLGVEYETVGDVGGDRIRPGEAIECDLARGLILEEKKPLSKASAPRNARALGPPGSEIWRCRTIAARSWRPPREAPRGCRPRGGLRRNRAGPCKPRLPARSPDRHHRDIARLSSQRLWQASTCLDGMALQRRARRRPHRRSSRGGRVVPEARA